MGKSWFHGDLDILINGLMVSSVFFPSFPIFSQHSVGNYGGARGEGSLVLQDAAYGIGATP